MLETTSLCCPYCGEHISTTVDCSGGDQNYYEDCSVCCRPIAMEIRVGPEGTLMSVDARRDDE